MKDSYDAMISFHVGSMGKSAKIVQEHLKKELGFSTFICTDMKGGDRYRDQIVKAVKSSKYFIILLNEEWASSGECEDEYSLAKRLNLTFHERSKNADREKPREPIIVPIAFPNLSWDKHYHVELLAAVTNFVLHEADSLEEGLTQNTINSLFRSIQSYTATEQASKPTTVATNPGNQIEQLSALLAEATNLLLPLKQQMRRQTGGGGVRGHKNGGGEQTEFELSKRFLGITHGIMNFSVELNVSEIDDLTDEQGFNECHGVIIYKLLSVTKEASNMKSKIGCEAKLNWQGSFQKTTGLLSAIETNVIMDDTGVTKKDWKPSEYRLLVGEDGSHINGTISGSSNRWDIAFRASAF